MTDEAYDAQTLATSARIERLHRLRFGNPLRTWTCPAGHVNRETTLDRCMSMACVRVRMRSPFIPNRPFQEVQRRYGLYGLADPEELIYSRAN